MPRSEDMRAAVPLSQLTRGGALQPIPSGWDEHYGSVLKEGLSQAVRPTNPAGHADASPTGRAELAVRGLPPVHEVPGLWQGGGIPPPPAKL